MNVASPNATPNLTRRMFAAVIRAFARGQLTNHEYEDVVFSLMMSDDWDDACDDLYYQIWFLYCDIQTHRMNDLDRPLCRNNPYRVYYRSFFARCVLFLRNTRYCVSDFNNDLMSPFPSPAMLTAASRFNTFLYGKPSI